MNQLTKCLNNLENAVVKKQERVASGKEEPFTVDTLRDDKQKALEIIRGWRKNAVLYSKKQAIDDCNFLIKFLNKLIK